MENQSKWILCLLIILICGCYQRSDTARIPENSGPISSAQTDSTVKNTRPEVVLSVLKTPMIGTQIEDTIRVKMFNNTADTLTTGLHYTVEFQDEGKWNKVSPPENVGSEDMGYGILPFTARDFLVELFPDSHNYRPGKYRVMKSYHLRDYSKTKRDYKIFAEFEIE